jgi:hypothetical protein
MSYSSGGLQLIQVNGATVTVEGMSFASTSRRAITVINSGSLTVDSISADSMTAVNYGGVLNCQSGSDLTVIDSTFTNNDADEYGGPSSASTATSRCRGLRSPATAPRTVATSLYGTTLP